TAWRIWCAASRVTQQSWPINDIGSGSMNPHTTSLETTRLKGNGESSTPAAALPSKPPLAKPLTDDEIPSLKNDVFAALCTCFDPEVPVNIYELGLIYEVTISPSGEVGVRMTLTSPACPVAGTLPGEVQRKVFEIHNVTSAKVEIVWDPPWTKDRMSEA